MMKRILLLSFVVLLIAQSHVEAQTKKEKKLQEKEAQLMEVQALLEDTLYVFKARSMQTGKGRAIDITSDYSLQVMGDSASCNLPFFGRAYRVINPAGDGGISFEKSMMEKYVKQKGKKELTDIHFEVKAAQDHFQMFLSVGATGYARLVVSSQNRETVSFSGVLRPLKEE